MLDEKKLILTPLSKLHLSLFLVPSNKNAKGAKKRLGWS